MHLFVGWFACTGLEQPEKESVTSKRIDPTEFVGGDNPPSEPDELPPTHNANKTNATLSAVSAGEIPFIHFKGCYVSDSIEGDAPKGHFLYAWNDTATVGLVLSIHHLSVEELPLGTVKTLSVTERDAFVMIEIGERIDTNFCVPSLKQIPIATVLESQTGSVQIKRTELGVEATVGTILFRDQYGKQEVSFDGLTIPAQEIDGPPSL